MPIPFFNVRVYGILINEKQQVLVTDEYRFGKEMTKFPGGGLHYGEGTRDCIRREMFEETGMETKVTGHFYTTDFFQPSAFDTDQQIIGIYYFIQPSGPLNFRVKEKQFDFDSRNEGEQIFRWLPLATLRKENFTFPIDQHVALLLIQTAKKGSVLK